MRFKNLLMISLVGGICLHADVIKTATDTYSSIIPKGTKISGAIGDDSSFQPDIYLPINWSDSFSSGVEYYSTNEIENDKVGGYSDSKKKTVLDTKTLNIYVLKYNLNTTSSTYSFGLGYSGQNIDKTQKGYIASSGVRLDYDHKMDIDIQGAYFSGEAIFRKITDRLSAKFNVLLLGGAQLDVSQHTSITSYPSAKGSSSENIDLIYDLRADFNYDVFAYLDVGFETRYKSLPMKYNLELAKTDGTFETKKYDLEEQILYNALKFYIKIPTIQRAIGNMRFMLGYSTQTTKSNDHLGNNDHSITSDKFIFGLSSKF